MQVRLVRCVRLYLPLVFLASAGITPALARPAPLTARIERNPLAQLAGKFDDEKIGFWSVNVSVDGTPRIASAQRLCEAVRENVRSR